MKPLTTIMALGCFAAHGDPLDRSFEMDIPKEWMKLSRAVRDESANLGREEVDLKWSPAATFFTPLKSYRGPLSLNAKWGTFGFVFTGLNLQPEWLMSTLRLRGEVDYTFYGDTRDLLEAHDLQLLAGVYLEPSFARWATGGVGVSASLLWQQWFSPDSRHSSSQNGYGGGLQSAVEVRQEVFGKRFGETLKTVLGLSRRDYFVGASYRSSHLLNVGIGFAL